jgi:ferredoxin-NADP reductase
MRDGARVGHVPGQHVDLIVPTPRGLAFRRSYSVASAPDPAHPERFEVAVTRVEGGPTSTALHALAPGAVVEVEGPRGRFVRSPEDRLHPGLFVATGTGLAPIRAMLAEEASSPGGPPLALLFGCRTPNDRLWHEELRRLAEACPRFTAKTTLSRPPSGWSGASGYVQEHVVALASSMPGARVYVCGLRAMVDDVVARVAAAGVPDDCLRYELYD